MASIIDEDGVIIDDGDGYYYHDYDTSSCTTSDSDTESDSGSEPSGCWGNCCCSDWEDECCYETLECCGGGGVVGDCGLGYGRSRSCGGIRKTNVKNKSKKETRKKAKGKGKGGALSFWQKCYPVKRKGDWGGDVIGVSRCPGEQDPKRWGFKTELPRSQQTPSVVVRHVCAPGSCYDIPRANRSRDREHHRRARNRSTAPERGRIGGEEEWSTHPRRGRRRTLLFDEYEAYPKEHRRYREDTPARIVRERRGAAPTKLVREKSDAPTRIVRESGSIRRRWGRRRAGDESDDDDDDDDLVMMRGALVDDSDRGDVRRRERSWERRSDPDDRIGEIDDRTEHSYVVGERTGVPTREDPGRRMVRFRRP